ncbi:MAG: hypothetical protein A2939_05605 [Parcubacteria group bacterium RIFCSPLOWO2_01_FULL_48_18]|nr:MAG: hypothetical protein A3J67_00995 [Parcubacteria group bacterium RIFCSPHIGHO2_02_FULL_48_10b]OHB22571.1 MAG: hypothetical protein A2939_05605 [Parcubacteria group bacterium RIFCSPLOWO2_01_FULL_48_18]
MQPPDKSLKIFDRSNRRFIGEIVIKDGGFMLVPDSKNKEFGVEIERQIWEITSKKPRLVYATGEKNGVIKDFFGNLPLGAREENFGILEQELGIFFSSLRFIEMSRRDAGPLKGELKDKIFKVSCLSPSEKEKLIGEIEKADVNELALISDDLKILERLTK